eukprot:469162_1
MSIKKDTIPPKIHDGTTKSLRTTLKESKNGDNNKISYNIQSNKSNKKFKEIIMNKIENNATHNLIHNPNIQRHNKKPLPIIDSHNNVNPDIKWECSMCTYMNLSIMKYCEICETPKQSNNNNDNKENKVTQSLRKWLENADLIEKGYSQIDIFMVCSEEEFEAIVKECSIPLVDKLRLKVAKGIRKKKKNNNNDNKCEMNEENNTCIDVEREYEAAQN